MKKLAFFLVIWLLSSEFSRAVESLSCDTVCAKDYDKIQETGCLKEGQECQITCRNEAQVNEYKGKCVRAH